MPLGYLEYQTWLQRAMPGADVEPSAGEVALAAAGVEGLSGIELLRAICRAGRPPSPKRRGVPRLTEEEKDLADTGLNGRGGPNEVLASRFSVDLTRGQLQCLRPHTWLNDEVINFYFKLLQERSYITKSPTVWFTNSFFWNKLSGGPAKSNGEYNYKEVKRWTIKAKVDIFELDYVIFPMNLGEVHWALGCIDFKERGFRYFDSMIKRPHPNFVPFLRKYLCDEHQTKKSKAFPKADEWDLIDMEVPQQQNSWDCGVFTCFFGDYFSAGRPLDFDQDDMDDLRVRLTARVVKADENWML